MNTSPASSSSFSAAGPEAGSSISHYRLIELLGRGAMGEVWLADDLQLPRKVAVKLLPAHRSTDGDAVDRLLREAKAAASVDHPGVVTVYDAGTESGRPYLVMQRVEGETLEERLKRGPLAVAEALGLVREVADALAEVHALGIVHRDLKPSNLVLTSRGVKVLDFGVASIKGAPGLTVAGAAVGSPLTMSPEQLNGQPADNRSDLWALGVVLYVCLTGRWPFDGPTFEAVAYRVLNERPAPPSQLRPEVGPDLDFMVTKLLRKDPAGRYARAEELLADLNSCEACVSAAPAPSAKEAGPSTPRLAVMPFEIMSSEADDAFLASGLVEDLIVDLTRVEGLQVASRAEVMPYKDRQLPPRTLGRELNADFLLLGSVRRAGIRARISAQLVRASDGHSVWAERFDRTLEDLFEVQSEVSRRIVEALQIRLKPEEREMLEKAPTRDHEAYGLYLRALELADRSSLVTNREAETLLKEATRRDPEFALAHGALAGVYAQRAWMVLDSGDLLDRAVESASRATELSPDLPEAHMAAASVQFLRGNPQGVLKALEGLSPQNLGQPQSMAWSGWAYMAVGQPEKARAMLQAVFERFPDQYSVLSLLYSCYEMLGRVAEAEALKPQARERLTDFVRRHPEQAHARSLLGIRLMQDGEYEAGVRQFEVARELAPEDGRIHYNMICALSRAGRIDEALDQMEIFIQSRGYSEATAGWFHRDPDLAALQGHPRLQAILAAGAAACRGPGGRM